MKLLLTSLVLALCICYLSAAPTGKHQTDNTRTALSPHHKRQAGDDSDNKKKRSDWYYWNNDWYTGGDVYTDWVTDWNADQYTDLDDNWYPYVNTYSYYGWPKEKRDQKAANVKRGKALGKRQSHELFDRDYLGVVTGMGGSSWTSSSQGSQFPYKSGHSSSNQWYSGQSHQSSNNYIDDDDDDYYYYPYSYYPYTYYPYDSYYYDNNYYYYGEKSKKSAPRAKKTNSHHDTISDDKNIKKKEYTNDNQQGTHKVADKRMDQALSKQNHQEKQKRYMDAIGYDPWGNPLNTGASYYPDAVGYDPWENPLNTGASYYPDAVGYDPWGNPLNTGASYYPDAVSYDPWGNPLNTGASYYPDAVGYDPWGNPLTYPGKRSNGDKRNKTKKAAIKKSLTQNHQEKPKRYMDAIGYDPMGNPLSYPKKRSNGGKRNKTKKAATKNSMSKSPLMQAIKRTLKESDKTKEK